MYARTCIRLTHACKRNYTGIQGKLKLVAGFMLLSLELPEVYEVAPPELEQQLAKQFTFLNIGALLEIYLPKKCLG